MSPKTILRSEQEQVREDILAAASQRFQTYGYGKTTMAEIAKDCSMSASNLYRYFENKHDIGAALASHCLGSQLEALNLVVESTEISSSAEKLKQFVLSLLHHTHHHWSTLPKMSELVDDICAQRRDILLLHMENKQLLLRKLLVEGQQTDEFVFDDIEATVDSIMSATLVFDMPHFMSFHSLSEFELKAENLTNLMVSGLANREQTAS
ncbi:MAG: AcrR family transcriptional regulator [Parasphingorhabdus sp.]|jgi:AcrR family transcriptional regulator